MTRNCVSSVSSVYKCFVIRLFRAIRVKFLCRHYREFVIFPYRPLRLALATHLSFFVAQNTIYNRLYSNVHIEKHHAAKANELRKVPENALPHTGLSIIQFPVQSITSISRAQASSTLRRRNLKTQVSL